MLNHFVGGNFKTHALTIYSIFEIQYCNATCNSLGVSGIPQTPNENEHVIQDLISKLTNQVMDLKSVS